MPAGHEAVIHIEVCAANCAKHAVNLRVSRVLSAKGGGGTCPHLRELLKHVHEQVLHRQEQNRTHMASMRASETFQQTLHRQ